MGSPSFITTLSNVEPNPSPQMVNFDLLNARSSVNTAALIHDVISDHRLDVVAVTEIWMLSNDQTPFNRTLLLLEIRCYMPRFVC